MIATPFIAETVVESLSIGLFKQLLTLAVTFWPVILFAIGVSMFRRFLSSAKGKGHIGEAIVGWAVLRKLDRESYHLFHDLYIERPDGKGTTQIDHVVVSRFGIFVIETKNMTGWIFGDVTSRQWTQCIYRKKQRFQNPLHQNALHINAFARRLELPPDCFHNVVFFVGDAVIKTDLPSNVMTSGLRRFIEARTNEVIGKQELERLVSEMGKLHATTDRKKAHREHVLQCRSR